MVHQILAHTSVEEMRDSAPSVSADTNEVGVQFFGEVQDARFHGTVIEDIEGVVVKA